MRSCIGAELVWVQSHTLRAATQRAGPYGVDLYGAEPYGVRSHTGCGSSSHATPCIGQYIMQHRATPYRVQHRTVCSTVQHRTAPYSVRWAPARSPLWERHRAAPSPHSTILSQHCPLVAPSPHSTDPSQRDREPIPEWDPGTQLSPGMLPALPVLLALTLTPTPTFPAGPRDSKQCFGMDPSFAIQFLSLWVGLRAHFPSPQGLGSGSLI